MAEKQETSKNIFECIFKKIKDTFYDISVWLYNCFKRFRKTKTVSAENRSKNIFVFCVLVYPVTIFIIFYIYVNFNSILLSLKEYDYDTGRFNYIGFENFKMFFYDLRVDYMLRYATRNSIFLYFFGLVVSMPLQIMCSFFVYKKIPLSGVYKVILYLPHIISAVVMVLMFKYFVDRGLPSVLKSLGVQNVPNFFYDLNTAFPTLIFFNVWMGLGGGIILYTGVMSRIPDSLIEYGELEGMTMWKEFWHITVPLIYPTITVFLVTGVAGIFTNQASVFTFYGTEAAQYLYTFGYFMFTKVVSTASISGYPYASAAGLIFTLIAAPITLIARYFFEKYGPTAEY